MPATGLASGLRVWCYIGSPLYNPVLKRDVSDYINQLDFTTVAPGGWGELNATVLLKKANIPRPEFSMFGRIAVMGGKTAIWLGELAEPAWGMDQQNGDYVKLAGLGLGNCLRDDPSIYAYSSSTAQAIAIAQVHQRTVTYNEWPLDTDTSQLFPDNPLTSQSPTYTNRTVEEILSDLSITSGDYNWGTEAHPINTDFAGFPTGRVFARKRDITTTGFMAQNDDILQFEMKGRADAAYNRVEIDYATTSGLGQAVVTDSRLAANYAQGSAPFRFRKYVRDLSSTTTVGATQANQIASTYLSQSKNPTYQGTMSVKAVRSPNGVPVPLWSAVADRNLFLPGFSIQGQQIPMAPTPNVNQFYITQARYSESAAAGNQQLDLDLGYYRDDTQTQIARLQMVADAAARNSQVTQVVQQLGAPIFGYVAWQFSNGVGGQGVGVAAVFQATCAQPPTSLTLTLIALTNLTGVTANAFTVYGANVFGTINGAGAGYYQGTFQTVGNCLKAINAEAGRFAWHCDTCERIGRTALFTDLALADHLRVNTAFGDTPGQSALAITCPQCGMVEAFNTALAARDEDDHLDGRMWFPHRAEQARLIRQTMAHPVVGLRRMGE